MSYGSGANWSGNDDSTQSATVNWSTDIAATDAERAAALADAGFTIPARATPVQAAEAMTAAWNAAHPNEQVTRNGSTVRWPAGSDIRGMSFSVNGGAPQTVPERGNAVPVYGGLTVQNIA